MSSFVMSEGGNDFLRMILDWEHNQEVFKEEDSRFVRAKMLVDGQDFIFFFTCRGSIYGANENARSVFSVMKNPLDEPGYEDMSFSATNLSNAMKGEPKEEVFIYKDIASIKVLNKEVARHMLMQQKKGNSDANVNSKLRDIQQSKVSQRSRDGRIKLHKDFEELQ